MKIPNPPESKSLMATARSFGNYDLSAALADLIDNSIKAKSKRIDIDFVPYATDVTVTIRDDGIGMSGNSLIAAMRPASKHPEEEREEDDLGRFGWGMKSASLSQARIMTVISWSKQGTFAASWNIDDIKDWSMEYYEGDEANGFFDSHPRTQSGTEIRWQNSDRLLRDIGDEILEDALTHLISQARESLALTFHRYISGDGVPKIKIVINGAELPQVDPFLKGHPSTQGMEPEPIIMSSGSIITIQAYVLPHFSKLTTDEQRILGGAEGMVRNQGFYVYRNKRLIIHGTWFKLIPHRDISQLTRVRVDLPNSVDHDWRITLDKSGAQIPSALKNRLRDVVRKFNRRSQSIHRKKGVSIDKPGTSPVWRRIVKSGQIKYAINRDHPMIENLMIKLSEKGEEFDFESTLTLLESYFPTDRFLQDASKGEVFQTLASDEDFEVLIVRGVVTYIQTNPHPHKLEDVLSYMRKIEPFTSHWTFVEEYIRDKASSILE